MRNNQCIHAKLVILALCFSFIRPLFAGGEDDDHCDDNGWDLNLGCGFVAIPLFWPNFDYKRARQLTQLPGTTIPVAQHQTQIQGKSDDDVVDQGALTLAKPHFLNASTKPALDECNGKKVVNLDHGCPENPFMVTDNGLFHIGMLLGGSVIDPHSGVQLNLLSRWQLTRGNWAYRYAGNHKEARRMKWAKSPKKASDFDTWEIGDSMRKNGIVGLTLYTGVGIMTADVRVGGLVKGIWSRMIQKIGESLIRVTFTREMEGGPLVRGQLMPMQKTEAKLVANSEDTRVYLFDLTKDDDRKALELVLDKRMLPAKSLADELAEDGGGTLLTTRQISRKRQTNTPFSIGIPFLFRFRIAQHNDRSVAVIENHRNNSATTITSKAYLKEKTHRHVNGRNRKQDKKWRYFMHSQQDLNRSYAGIVTQKSEPGEKETVTASSKYLDVHVSFSHDNAKVKKINEYAERISKMIGLNDIHIDTRYERDARIGFAEIVYKLKVGNAALEQLIEDNAAQKDIFTRRAKDLIDEYFIVQKDPHGICDSSHDFLRRRCLLKVRKDTFESLKDINEYLRKLATEKVKNSETKSAHYIARIAKELSTNHFVLQTFILSLPQKVNGYGKLEIFGEQLLARRLPVDPNVPHNVEILPEDAAEDLEEDGYLVVDWDRINIGEEGGHIF